LKEQKKAILKKLEEVELKLYEADKENKNMEKKFRQKITEIENDAGQQVTFVKDQLTKTLGRCEELEVRRSEAEEEKRLMAAKVSSVEDQMIETLEKCRELEVKLSKAEEEKVLMGSKATSMEERTMKTLEEWKELGLKLSKAEKEKKKMEEKYKQVVTEAEKLAKDLKDEKELNRCLVENQASLKETLIATEEKVKDLQEGNADLMRHLEEKDRIARLPDGERQELQDGQLFVGGGASTHRKKKSRRKK